MVLPLYDNNPTRTVPFVTISLIVINILVFLFESSLSQIQLEALVRTYAFTPAVFSQNGNISTIFTAMFMHGGFVHVAGNMLYLWIFGNNIEDALGHGRFLLFYLLAGVVATMTHSAIDPASSIPVLGASGAIAGVLGGYLVLFPSAQIVSLVPFIFFFMYRLPAIIVIGLWFLIQTFNGFFSIVQTASTGAGIAWFAHIGGFIAGLIMITVIPKSRSFRPGR